jgi:site-specific DNA recombinase
MLAGIVKCGCCGMGMVSSIMKNGSGKSTHYYRCVTRSSPHYKHQKKCPNRYIPINKVETAVWNAIINVAKGVVPLSSYLVSKDVPDYSPEIEKLSAKYEQSKKKQAEIIKWFRGGIIDAALAEKDLAEMNREINTVSERLAAIKSSQQKIKKSPIISLETALTAKTIEEKRKVVLDYEIKVFLKREGKEFDFWFSH